MPVYVWFELRSHQTILLLAMAETEMQATISDVPLKPCTLQAKLFSVVPLEYPAKEATGTDMTRFDDKRLIDIVLGEAILALLSEGEPITPFSLIEKLQRMAVSEKMAFRKQACTNAIMEVQASLMTHSPEHSSFLASSEYLYSSKTIH